MSQPTDMTISNQLMPQARTELNAILAALLSLNAGGSAPSYKVDHTPWLDISETPWVLKLWDGNDWIPFIEFNATANKVNFVNIAGGDARTEAANIGQIQDGDFNWLGTITGATNTLTATLTPAITAYKAGMCVWGIAAGSPTGAATLALNSLSAKAVQNKASALKGGEWKSGELVGFVYDGTQWQLIDTSVIKRLVVPSQGELTINTGAVTVTGTRHLIDTESDAASDDLDTISGGVDGQVVIVRAANAARTVVIKHGTGNIETPDGNDIALDAVEKEVVLIYDGATSDWHVVSAPASSISDPFQNMPIGEEFSLHPDAPVPDNSAGDAKYIELTAGLTDAEEFNEGLLISENSTGSGDSLVVTAVVDLEGSDMDGVTVDLINSSRRFLRPGSAGTNQSSDNKEHTHTSPVYFKSTASGSRIESANTDTSLSANVSTNSSGGSEARPMNTGRTYYMRIR